MSLSKNIYDYEEHSIAFRENSDKYKVNWQTLMKVNSSIYTRVNPTTSNGPGPSSSLVGLAQHSGPRTNLAYRPVNSLAGVRAVRPTSVQYISAQDHSKPKLQNRAQ